MPLDDRTAIARLARNSRAGIIDLPAAASALNLTSRDTSIRLTQLTRKGWVTRAKRGLYLVLPLEVEPGKPAVAQDSWVVASAAFSPCYIGGWSAAEYWGLTEQIFRSIVVVTGAAIRSKSQIILGQEFRLFKVPLKRLNVKTSVWRTTEKLLVSSRERTLIDGLRNPEMCAGTRLLISMFSEYMQSPQKNMAEFQREVIEAGNGAAWKRLGLLLETFWPENTSLIERAEKNSTLGNIKLDPNVKFKGKLSKKWGVWINVALDTND